jgi:hypothetical protein
MPRAKKKEPPVAQVTARDGARLTRLEEDILKPSLLAIFEERGDCSPQELYRRAKRDSDPLHRLPRWSWNNPDALRSYDLQVAQTYVRAFDIHFEGHESVRAFPNVVINGKRTNVMMTRVLSEQDLLDQVVNDALEQAKAWRRRWEHLRDVAKLAPIFAALDGITL